MGLAKKRNYRPPGSMHVSEQIWQRQAILHEFYASDCKMHFLAWQGKETTVVMGGLLGKNGFA